MELQRRWYPEDGLSWKGEWPLQCFWHWPLDGELGRDLDLASQIRMQNICKVVIDKSKILELSLNWPSASSLQVLKLPFEGLSHKRRLRGDGTEPCPKGHLLSSNITHNEDCGHLPIEKGSVPAATPQQLLSAQLSASLADGDDGWRHWPEPVFKWHSQRVLFLKTR